MLKRSSDFFDQDLSKASNVDKFSYTHSRYKTTASLPSEEKTAISKKYSEPRGDNLKGNLTLSADNSLQRRALQGRKVKTPGESKNQQKWVKPPHVSATLFKPQSSRSQNSGRGDTVRALGHLESIEFLAKELKIKIHQCYENYPEHYKRKIKILSGRQHQALVKYLKDLLGKNADQFAWTGNVQPPIGPPSVPYMQSIRGYRLYLRRLIFLPHTAHNPAHLREIFKIFDKFEESYGQVTQLIDDLKRAVSFQKRAQSHSKFRYRRRARRVFFPDSSPNQTITQKVDVRSHAETTAVLFPSLDPSD